MQDYLLLNLQPIRYNAYAPAKITQSFNQRTAMWSSFDAYGPQNMLTKNRRNCCKSSLVQAAYLIPLDI